MIETFPNRMIVVHNFSINFLNSIFTQNLNWRWYGANYYQIIFMIYLFYLYELMLNIPVNNCSVMSGYFSGLNPVPGSVDEVFCLKTQCKMGFLTCEIICGGPFVFEYI